MRTTREILEAAKAAVPALASANAKIDGALLKIADMLCEKEALEAILDANKKDIDRAEGISEVMKDRLRLDEKRRIKMDKAEHAPCLVIYTPVYCTMPS